MSRPSIVFAMLAVLLSLSLAIAVTACGTVGVPPGGETSTTDATGGPDTTSTSIPGPSTTLPGGAIQHPAGAADVVLRIVTGGGFVPVEYNLTLLPEFTLYGDGRIVATGPTTLEYPGRALPNLQTAVLSEEAVQRILAAAKDAGLFQNGVDYGYPNVADLGTTTITINAEGTTYTAEIYALGFEDSGSLSQEQQQARDAIDDLRGRLSDPTGFSDTELDWEPYDFSAVKVFSRPVDPNAQPGDIQPNRLPWPLADLAVSGEPTPNVPGVRQVVISGDELSTLRPLLEKATQITLWESEGVEYNLYLRPLLPDEAAAL
jgi:hypothetical protein